MVHFWLGLASGWDWRFKANAHWTVPVGCACWYALRAGPPRPPPERQGGFSRRVIRITDRTVLDNADDLVLFSVGRTPEQSTSLYSYVPKTGTGAVLWTSRIERIVGTLVGPRQGARVGGMSLNETRRLLETSRNGDI